MQFERWDHKSEIELSSYCNSLVMNTYIEAEKTIESQLRVFFFNFYFQNSKMCNFWETAFEKVEMFN